VNQIGLLKAGYNAGWIPPAITFVDDATITHPSVASDAGWYVFPAVGGARAPTTFDDGEIGKEITVYFTDNQITLDHGVGLQLDGNVDYNPPAQAVMKFFRDTAARWREITRAET
jgi:hypothetical protein